MKKNGRMGFVLLEDHADVLALLNDTVDNSAGSSKKKKLLPRIYRKWKGALPDLENAPLFKVIGRKKGYDDASGRAYRFDEKTTDAWAKLFEYKGSGEKVRLRLSVERLGVALKDVVVAYGDLSDGDERRAWERLLHQLMKITARMFFSVMISTLGNQQLIFSGFINQAMLLIDAARPVSFPVVT